MHIIYIIYYVDVHVHVRYIQWFNILVVVIKCCCAGHRYIELFLTSRPGEPGREGGGVAVRGGARGGGGGGGGNMARSYPPQTSWRDNRSSQVVYSISISRGGCTRAIITSLELNPRSPRNPLSQHNILYMYMDIHVHVSLLLVLGMDTLIGYKRRPKTHI